MYYKKKNHNSEKKCVPFQNGSQITDFDFAYKNWKKCLFPGDFRGKTVFSAWP